MPKSARIKTLEYVLRDAAKPAVEERGFKYDAKSRIFRRKCGECTQIIEFQVGVRSCEGEFTVNLAIFHPKYNETYDGVVPENKAREYPVLTHIIFFNGQPI